MQLCYYGEEDWTAMTPSANPTAISFAEKAHHKIGYIAGMFPNSMLTKLLQTNFQQK